ncbi:MAG TPA: alpha-rhamnosidase, partial [Chitinophagaceae bacterium]
MYKLFFTLLLLLPASLLKAQANTINPTLLKGSWQADWISCPGIAQRAYGVYHFRKVFELNAKPDKFIIHISADNRYRLFVNGHTVCSGPARGNLYNWDFETVDIAPFLESGKNIIAVLVWNMGEYAAVAQVSNQTALVVQGDAGAENGINTNSSWKVYRDNAYTPCSMDNGQRLHAYMVTGPGDRVKGVDYPYGWEQLNYADSSWLQARPVMRAEPAGYGSDNLWTLVPRTIPLMEETMQRIKTIRRSSGMGPVSDFISGKDPLTVPAHKTASILLDQSYETVAYPELIVSGGKGAVIKMTYAEALFKGFQKGNRNDIEGR